MSQKIYLKILRWGIYLSFFSVLLTWRRFYFPYISTKQIYFNILLEILFVFWLAFIVKYPSWRPKKSWISFGLIGFFSALLISCFKSVDFNLSFWGDIERMLGFFSLVHFLILYFVIITVMRSWEDWRNLFLVFCGVGVLVSFHGIAQRLGIITSPWGSGRIIATIGNAAYVGAYTIFNLFFLFILFFKTRDRIWRIFLGAASFIILLALIFSGTRGAYLGFGAGVVFMLILSTILSKNKKVKVYSLVSFLILIITVSAIFSKSDSNFVKHNSFLSRITQINLNDATMQTRFISWRAAAKDFKNHPVLGTGLGNYAIIFDKYFDPTFYNYTRSETYFDQAHNNLIDIVSTTGLLGLITYLSIFIVALFYLIWGLRKNKIGQIDFILLFGLIVAYFIQNLVVFDALVTYIALMAMLGYIYWLSHNDKDGAVLEEKNRSLENKEIYIFFIIGIVILIVMYQFNIKPAKMLMGTIDGQIAFAKGDTDGAVDAYKKALSYNTVLDRDSRASFLRYVNSMPLNGDKKKTMEVLDYAISLAEKNVKYNPSDNLMELQFAQVLDSAARVSATTGEKFYYYSNWSLEVIEKAIQSSPGRIPVYFIKAQIYLTRGEAENAIETLKYAISLNGDYYESSCQLAKIYIILGREEEGYPLMDRCIDMGGESLLTPASFVKILINHYLDKEDTKRLINLHEILVGMEPNDAMAWVNLSKLYLQAGEKLKAIEAAEKSAQLDKSLEASVEKFIENLK
jgi:O-antigen ligase